MEMRTSEEMPELSICGTPLRLITTLLPPLRTIDCSASFNCSLGSPIVRRPRTSSKATPFCCRTEISIGRCSVMNSLLEFSRDGMSAIAQRVLLRLYDRQQVLDNHRIRILHCAYENLRERYGTAARIIRRVEGLWSPKRP